MTRSLRGRIAPALLLLGLSGLLHAAPESPDAKVPEEDTPPPINSPYLNWQFNAPLAKVKEALQALMKEDGLSFKEDNSATGDFVTDLAEFDEKKFGVDVSIPPPRANPKYPWLQSIAMTSGRFGLQGKLVSMGPTSTRLDLRALLEIPAINSKVGGRRWVPRYSNGTIEHLYITRLSLRLLPPPASDGKPG